MSANLMELALNPHQDLIDALSAWSLWGTVDRLSAMLVIRDAQANICPVCGEDFKSYGVVSRGYMRGLCFRHADQLSCHMDFGARGSQ